MLVISCTGDRKEGVQFHCEYPIKLNDLGNIMVQGLNTNDFPIFHHWFDQNMWTQLPIMDFET